MPVGYYGKRSRRGRFYRRRRFNSRSLFAGRRRYYYGPKASRGWPQKAPEDRIARHVPPPSYLSTFKKMSSIDANFSTDATGLANSLQLSVSLADLPGVADVGSLYDQYRILSIKAHLFFVNGNVGDITTGIPNMPLMYVSEDIDDKTPISLTTMEQRADVRVVQVGSGTRTSFDVNVPPFVLSSLLGLDSTSGTSPVRSPWIDMSNQDLDHGVVKWIVTGSPSTEYRFRVVYEVVFQGKMSR